MKTSLFQKTIDSLDLKHATSKGVSEWLASFQTFASHLNILRFTEFQKNAFNLIRKVSKYDQFLKRDGSIISIILHPIDNNSKALITNTSHVNLLLIQYLKDKDNSLKSYLPTLRVADFPNLPPLQDIRLKNLLARLSQHKALAIFPVPDEHLKLYLRQEFSANLFNHFWTPEFLFNFPEIFDCKLVPLNKIHPKVPRVDQMRPIVITNPIYKLLESRFLTPLQDHFFKLNGFGLSHYGFLPFMTTQIPINNLLSKITEGRNRLDGKLFYQNTCQISRMEEFVLYIDFEAAYNSINLQLLFDRISNTNIIGFCKDDALFLFSLISKLNIHLGDSHFNPQFGVPQGGITSPILFNYAMFFMLQETLDLTNHELATSDVMDQSPKFKHDDIYTWADDLAIRFSAKYGKQTKIILKIIIKHL